MAESIARLFQEEIKLIEKEGRRYVQRAMEIEKIFDKIKTGELVLTPHYMTGDKVPGRVILSKFASITNNASFFAKDIRVLHRARNKDDLPPLVSEEYEGCQYAFEEGYFGSEEKYRVKLNPFPHNGFGEIYAGIFDIVAFLNRTDGYEAHAAALRASNSKRLGM